MQCGICEILFDSKDSYKAHVDSIIHRATLEAIDFISTKIRSQNDYDRIPKLKESKFIL